MEAVRPYAVHAGLAALLLAGGFFLAWLLRKVAARAMRRGRADPMVARFASQLAYILIIALAVAAALGELGVQTASIVAVIGAAGIAIGLALQNSLANLASGLMLITLRPFSVGDYIDGGGCAGTVMSVGLFATTLRTFDGVKIVVPNAKLTDGNIIDYSTHSTRRFDTSVSVAYASNLDFVKETVLKTLSADERVLPDPAPVVSIDALGDSGVVVGIRVWTESKNYWPLRFELLGKIKADFDAAGIEIPFPQRVVRMVS